MNKKYLITYYTPLLVIIFCCLAITQNWAHSLYRAPIFTSTEKLIDAYKTEKPIILWDIHEVLFTPYKGHEIWTNVRRAPNKCLILKEFLKNVLQLKTWRIIYQQAVKANRVKEAYFEAFNNSPELYNEFIVFANAIYKPNKTLFDLIEILHNLGYEQYIFSNIGPDVFAHLKMQHP